VIAGDFGGFVGLFLGGSVITFCEILDLFLYNIVIKMSSRRQVGPSNRIDNKRTGGVDVKPYNPYTESQEKDWTPPPKMDDVPKLHVTSHY